MTAGGDSTCPICAIQWTVTVGRDCLIPACGCYGYDPGPDNPARPCEPCGINHALACPKMSTRTHP